MPSTRSSGTLVVALTFLATWVRLVSALEMAYCASINTASDSGTSDNFQSDGLCRGQCQDSYAFAVLQDDICWCSNFVPDESTQVDTSKCDTSCPGFPDDTCGGDGLFGYILLNQSPSGTIGGSTSSSTTAPDTPTDTKPANSPVSTTGGGKQTTAPASPSVSIATVTAGGLTSLQTITVLPTAATAPTSGSSDAGDDDSKSNHLSTGAAVGTAIGVLGGVVILGGVAGFLWLRRKRQQQAEELADGPGSHRGSSTGVLGTPTTAMASMFDGENGSMGRRSSRLMPHDPRMDPYTSNIYARFENKSRESINTLQDNHDYSRKVLRTTNPDPPDQQ
ncbi:hypothetical protein F4780DRAFT_788318 [Xylariomycetidae sp. FL0641]|nr:hypothetical protein F4780DRAFT_788318 [Xylariomycetidae sp. FL0641]